MTSQQYPLPTCAKDTDCDAASTVHFLLFGCVHRPAGLACRDDTCGHFHTARTYVESVGGGLIKTPASEVSFRVAELLAAVDLEKQRKAEREQRERAEYERLKEKFG